MGFYFRRSVNLGPFRVNVSRGGLGWSVGGRGFRTGSSARGRRYTTISIPGTGVGYRTSAARRGCLLSLALVLAVPSAIVLLVLFDIVNTLMGRSLA
ncbi:MAG: hypothetical protein RIR10_2206 [Planctomycetota bacterium]|jgi:hypothetical protein